jgi:hypothetical protein
LIAEASPKEELFFDHAPTITNALVVSDIHRETVLSGSYPDALLPRIFGAVSFVTPEVAEKIKKVNIILMMCNGPG